MDTMSKFGPWAVVTGASSGIGLALAGRLAHDGINLVLAARSQQRLQEIGRELTAREGTDHRVVAVDLARAEGPAELLDATSDLDVGLLVSNAGDGAPRDLLDHDLAELHHQLRLNAVSHLELVHHFAARLVARGGGGILLTSASGGRHGMPHMANVAAAKGYVHHLGEALNHELAPHGVHVTVLLPGNVDTPVVDRLGLRGLDVPLPLISPDTAAKQALQALAANRATLVPGRALRFGLRLVPRRLSVRLNGDLLARTMASPSTSGTPA